MKISLIAAMAANRVIGRDGGLPWHLPPDLRRFKRLTMGHVMILGRKTWESIGRALPGRTLVVVTRQEDLAVPEGVAVVPSVEEALRLARERETDGVVFVAGGAEVYRQTLPLADRLELTRIEQDFAGDTFFPEFAEADWRLVTEERHEPGTADNPAPFAFSFQTWERVRPEAAS
jgi:dihydrofolate reductase